MTLTSSHAWNADRDATASTFAAVRAMTERISKPLEPEDLVIQSMPDASPVRWHLAHTTWFFETFVLKRFASQYQSFHPAFEVLFNSYYNTVGAQFPRDRRGLLSRPTAREIFGYRKQVDEAVIGLLEQPESHVTPELRDVVKLGLQHEQQHQELILTDVLHMFSCNPIEPAYRPVRASAGDSGSASADAVQRWVAFEGGLCEIGHTGAGFGYDNEFPRHRAWLRPYALAARPVTNASFMAFVEDGGYARPELWLSEGWAVRSAGHWQAPLYWQRDGDEWTSMTLSGRHRVEPSAPACHISYFEADAFARWSDARLPTEFEWEAACEGLPIAGNFLESESFEPLPCMSESADAGKLKQMFGDVWEWTASPYIAYPGYRPWAGAAGEYNGKFMCNQYVLRGGSIATPQSHVRATYRNFFPPAARWQFAGVRLAKDV